MKLLRIALFFEVLMGSAWLLLVGATPRIDLGGTMVLFVLAPPALVAMAIGVWKLITEEGVRPLAATVVILPVAFLFAPMVLHGIFGAHVLAGARATKAWGVLLAGPLVFTVLRPRTVGSYLPRGLFESRMLNLAILLVLIMVALALLALGIAFFQESTGPDVAPQAFKALVPVVVAGAAFSVPVILFAYLGFFQKVGRSENPLRIAQLILAIPIPLVVAAGFLLVMGLSYG